MNERELGQALLNYGAHEPATAPPPDPRILTQKILKRDRQQVYGWASLTLLVWGLTVGCMGYLLYLLYDELTGFGRDMPTSYWTTLAEREFLPLVGLSLGGLLLATVSTVLLVFATRRATLRQVNANLMEISQQLKELQQSLANQAGRPTTVPSQR
jgi:hypothetical protein